MPASAIDRLPTSARNRAMERLSASALRLRGRASFGRNDALEQTLARLGVIPVLAWTPAVSLTANVQGFPPAAGTVTFTPDDASGAETFAKGDAARTHTFGAAGTHTLTATFTGNANAKGRGTVSV